MGYCVPLGIPHTVFLGWKQEDRDKVLAYQIRESERCPTCHQFTDDWQDPETHRPLNPPPLDVTEWYCEPCAQIDKANERKHDAHGVSIRLRTPKPEVEPEPTMM